MKDLRSRELPIVNCEAEQLAGPTIRLARSITQDQSTAEVSGRQRELGRGHGESATPHSTAWPPN